MRVSADFRKMMSTLPGRAANLRAMPGAGQASTRQQLRTIVVFVINNRVTQTAVDIACSIAKWVSTGWPGIRVG